MQSGLGAGSLSFPLVPVAQVLAGGVLRQSFCYLTVFVVGYESLKAVMVGRKDATLAMNALVVIALGCCYSEDMVNWIVSIY
jgi:hypothetical protein